MRFRLAAGAACLAALACACPAAAQSCAARGSRTLAANRYARVYVSADGRKVVGCARSGHGRSGLTELSEGGPNRYARVAGVQLRGTTVAFAVNARVDYDYLAGIDVKNLARRRTLHDWLAFGGGTEISPGPPVEAASLVLGRRGAVAWVARYMLPQGPKYSVYKAVRKRSGRRIDAGFDIDPASLTLVGERVTWHHGSAIRSSPLRGR